MFDFKAAGGFQSLFLSTKLRKQKNLNQQPLGRMVKLAEEFFHKLPSGPEQFDFPQILKNGLSHQ